jgi:hypothetical protein
VAASKGTYPDAILVSWKASAGATSYLIYRAETKTIPSDSIATTSDLSYMDPKDATTDPGKTFNYWVKASNSVVNSVPSTMVSGNISNVPAAPSAVTVSNGKYFDRVTVSWPKVAGATSFEIFRLPGDGGADAKTISGASAAKACVITAAGHGFTSGNLVLINGITGSMATLLNGKSFAVTVKDADTFSVPVSTLAKTYVSGGFAAKPVIKDMIGYDSSMATYTYTDTATVTDPNPAPSAPCYYWVKSVNSNGASALKMGSNTGSVNDTGPSSPAASQGKFVGKIRVTWKAVAGATDYEVTDETGTVINTVSALTCDFTVADTTSHSFKVRANLKSEGTMVYQSKFSKLCTGFACSKAITSLAAPVVKASNGVYSHVMLTWTEVPLALKYNVYRKVNAADGWGAAIASDISSLTYNDDGATADQKYFYCVESVNGALATKSTAVSGFAAVAMTDTVVGDTFSSLGLTGVLYSQKFYEITVPTGTSRLVAKVENVSGSCDIYAKIGRYPTTTDKNAKGIAIAKTDDRILTVANPVAGTWYILVYGTGSYSNADLSIDYYTSTDIVFTQVPANDQAVPFTASFKGQVLDRSGTGIAGIVIGVRDPITGLETWLAKTDKSGYFTYPISIKAEGEYTFDFFFTAIPDNTNSIGSWTVKTNKNPAGVFDSAVYLTGTSIDLSSSTSPSLAAMQSYMNVRRGFTDGPATTDSEEFWVKNTLGAAGTDANIITSTLKPGLYFLLYGTEGAAVGNGKEAKPGLTASPLLVRVGSSFEFDWPIVQNMLDNKLVEDSFAENLIYGGIGVIVLTAVNNKDEDTDDIIGYDISLSSSEQLELLANLAGNISGKVSVSDLNLNDAKFGNFFTSLVYIKIGEDPNSRNIGVRLSTFSDSVQRPPR